MQPLAILFGAAFTSLTAYSFGALLLRKSCPHPAIRLVAGCAPLSLSIFVICCLHLAYPAVFLAGGTAVAAAAWRELPAIRSRTLRVGRPLLPFLPFLILYFFNSMAPEISYDGSRYHLGLAGRYLREHGFQPITDNFYASLSQGVEMLYLFAYAFGRHSAAAMVHFVLLMALTAQIYSYGRRLGHELAGWGAALLVFASPIVGVDGSSAYVDVAVAAIAFTVFHLLEYEFDRRILIAIGLLAGFAYAAKYTAALALPYAIGAVWWKTRRFRDAAWVATFASFLMLPWMAKNYLYVHNPVAPFFNQYFPNNLVTVIFEREYRSSLAGMPVSFGSLSVLGPIFVLAPFALFALRRAAGRRLLLAAIVYGAPFYANVSARFLIPPLPFVALAMMLEMASFPRFAIAAAFLHVVLSWPDVLRRYCPADAWHLVKVPYREALRIKPEEGFLESNLPLYGATRMVERETSPGSTVFAITPIPEAYTSRHIRVAYQSAGNIMSRNVFWIGFVPEHMPSWRLQFRFPRQELGSFRILQTASGKDVWSMHEVRVFDGAQELPRAGWRSAANGILDGSPVTFWMAGDTLQPGQSVQVDPPDPVLADSVLVEAAPDQFGIQLRLEGKDRSGSWKTLATEPVPDTAIVPDLRGVAARELKRRGNDYLLMFDGEFGADDLQRNLASWGVRQVSEYKGARLYKLP